MDSVRATDDNDSSGSNWHYLYTKTYIPWRSRETSVRFLSEIPSIRSICWFRIAREFIDSDFWSSMLSSILLFFLDRAAFPHSTRPASSRTCTIDATKIVNSIIEEIRKRATIWHQISGGVERAAVRSGKTIKKRRLLVKVSTERPLGSGKQITITGTWEHTDGMNKIRTVNII